MSDELLKSQYIEQQREIRNLRKIIKLAADDMVGYQDKIIALEQKLGITTESALGRWESEDFEKMLLSYGDLDDSVLLNRKEKKKTKINNPEVGIYMEEHGITHRMLATYIGMPQRTLSKKISQKLSDANKEIAMINLREMVAKGIDANNIEHFKGQGMLFKRGG